MAEVSEIYLYPVKSCRGIRLQAAYLTPTGLEWDRQWMIVNPNGRFITQRQFPRLATVEVALPVEALDHKWRPLGPDSALCLNAPGMEPLFVPLLPACTREKVEVSVWGWTGLAFDEGPSASEWLSKYVGKPGLRLIRFDLAGATRLTDPTYAPGYKTAFADGYPLLLISEASMDALNDRMQEPLPINRFRPNVVVRGCQPYDEDLWRKFSIGGHRFQGVSLCSRCKMPTINQETGEVGKEPLPALKQYRVGQQLGTSSVMKGQVYFGQNVVCDDVNEGESFTIAVGDEVEVLDRFESITALMNGVKPISTKQEIPKSQLQKTPIVNPISP